MKLKHYNNSNVAGNTGTRPAVIRITRHGVVVLNTPLVNVMGLTLNAGVDIVQNEEAPSEWFVVKSADKDGFILRKQQKKEKAPLMFNSANMANIILSTVKDIDKLDSVSFRVGIKPTEQDGLRLYPILTASWKEFQKGVK